MTQGDDSAGDDERVFRRRMNQCLIEIDRELRVELERVARMRVDSKRECELVVSGNAS